MGGEAGRQGSGNITAREVARQIYGESGLRGFYRGFGVSVLQFAPTSAVSCCDAAIGSGVMLMLLLMAGRVPKVSQSRFVFKDGRSLPFVSPRLCSGP